MVENNPWRSNMTLNLGLCKGKLKRVMVASHFFLGVTVWSCHYTLTRADRLPDSLWQLWSLPPTPAFFFCIVLGCAVVFVFVHLPTSFAFRNMKCSSFSIRYGGFFSECSWILFFFNLTQKCFVCIQEGGTGCLRSPPKSVLEWNNQCRIIQHHMMEMVHLPRWLCDGRRPEGHTYKLCSSYSMCK